MGCTLELGPDNHIRLHQIEYIKERLHERGREVNPGRVGLPENVEGKVEPVEDRTTKHYLDMKHLCQEEVGVLIWIASRTRPDVAGSVSIASTLTTFNPDEGFTLIKGIWKYLASTAEYYLDYGSFNASRVTVFTDASFAPGGDRSRSGVVVVWKGGIVHWYTKRQPLATLSAPESELGASIPGIKFGIGIKQLTDQLVMDDSITDGFDLMGDNTATVITLTKEISSWRTRHYAICAGWSRDQVTHYPIQVSHLPGAELPADGLTKVLQGIALRKTRIQLTLRNGKEDEQDVQLYSRSW